MEIIDKFQIIEHIGSGYFGSVYRCYDPFMKKEIAVKVIQVSNPIKFVEAVKEGQTLDICRHKYIVDMKDVRATFFNGSHVVIIIMEYLAKGSIQKHIEKRFISVQESCKIIQQSLLGLEYAHNNKILHRDIKPGNILIGENNEAKLSDFGLAVSYTSEYKDTLNYYRPHIPLEVIEGGKISRLSDIYAMGLTFYRLLNNRDNIPFPFATKDAYLNAVKKELYPPRVFSAHIPSKIIQVLKKSINKNKDKRFQNCSDFRQAIEKINFEIDWVCLAVNEWVGVHNSDSYILNKVSMRNGWSIDFKKNGKRKGDRCYSNLSEQQADEILFRTIVETTLN